MAGSARSVLLSLAILIAAAASSAGCSRDDAPPVPGVEKGPGPVAPGPAAAVALVDDVPLGSPAPPAPPPLDRALRVIIGGDLLPHRPSLVAPAAIHAALAPLAPLFGKADAVVANYEAATGDVDPKGSRLAYAAPRGWLEELPKSGIKAVTLANNHACDLGEPGLDATLEGAAKSGLVALGADADDPWEPRVIVEQSGKRICVVAWTTISNAGAGTCANGRHLAVAPLSFIGKQRIDRAFEKARATCDATIAIFHGGDEYAPQTTMVMDQAAHAAEAGADAVVIHHPHIASPVVMHVTRDGRSVPLFASVGNLVTNQGESWKPSMFPVLTENRRLVCVNAWTRLGVLADLSFTFDEAAKHPRLDWGMHLLWIDNEHAVDHTVATPKIEARLLDPTRDKVIIEKLSEDVRGPRALFADPCWFERSGASRVESAAAAPRDARCSSEPASAKAAVASSSTVATAARPKKSRARRNAPPRAP